MANEGSSTAEFVNPFLSAISNTFGGMIPVEAKRSKVFTKEKEDTQMMGEISSIISFMGDFQGTAVMSFPRRTAIFLASSFMGDPNLDDFGFGVFDCMGEIGNLVCGSAKSAIASNLKLTAQISTPTVIAGSNHHFLHRSSGQIIGIQYTTEKGDFVIELSINL